jgi:hypothetical protein
MIGPDAAIIPGVSAGGLKIGMPVSDVLSRMGLLFTAEPVVNPHVPAPLVTRYRSEMVDFWDRDGLVDQVMVHHGYRGKMMGKIGLGSTIADAEELIGPVGEDDEDNLVIEGIDGLVFEIEGHFPGLTNPSCRTAPIKEICVCPVGERR